MASAPAMKRRGGGSSLAIATSACASFAGSPPCWPLWACHHFSCSAVRSASVTYAEPSIEDYADRTAEQLKWWQAQSGQQGGDPAKLAQALVAIASEEPPPRRFIAGADAIGLAEQKIADLQAQIAAYRGLSTSLSLDELAPAGSAR